MTQALNPILQYFEYGYLPIGDLQQIAKQFYLLAYDMQFQVADGPEKSAGLRKLLEAKDCFVRAGATAPNPNLGE